MPRLFASWIILVVTLVGAGAVVGAFDPRAYSGNKQTAQCKAVRRSPPPSKDVDIKIRYVDIKPRKNLKPATTILMVHGWPSLWSTWSKQIEEFENDYRLIIPNLRGFGDSTHTGDVRSSGTMGDMVNDLVCVLNNAGVRQAVCLGHDWGSGVCYEAVRARPDVFIGVIGAAIPYVSAAGPFLPIKDLVPRLPKLAYQLFFDGSVENAAAELDADVKRTMRAALRTVDSPPPKSFLTSNKTFLGAWEGVEIPPVPFFSPVEEEYYVEEMGLQGFKHTLHFYTSENRYHSWAFAHGQGNHTLRQPALAVYPTKVSN
ncbi:hypothetical protein H1R20_g16152, partial [Candolleomyces eurysporus]